MTQLKPQVIQYTYPQFLQDVYVLGEQISHHGETDDWKPNLILALARGGLTFGAYLAHRLNVKGVITADTFLDVPPKKYHPKPGRSFRVLVVDDISDSGDTLDIYMGALRAKAKEDGHDLEILSATLWIRYNTKFIPDYHARIINSNAWIEFPWEGDITRTTKKFFLELLSHKHQTFNPPALLAILPLSPEEQAKDEAPSINVVPEPEYATSFNTSHEAMIASQEIGRRSDDYQELFAIGVPVVSEHIFNTEKHTKYWDSYNRQLALLEAQERRQRAQAQAQVQQK
jgi:hypoxanthine phosphoribosyltransferase